jgi:hypothetical protein
MHAVTARYVAYGGYYVPASNSLKWQWSHSLQKNIMTWSWSVLIESLNICHMTNLQQIVINSESTEGFAACLKSVFNLPRVLK